MRNAPINEGPPNKTALIAEAIAEIGDQYDGIRDVLDKLYEVLQVFDQRLSCIERKLK